MNEIPMSETDIKAQVRQHWNGRAAEFDQVPHHGLHSEQQHRGWLRVLDEVAGGKAIRILDLGCGTGFLSLLLAELGHTVTGLDFASEMLGLARQKAADKQLEIDFRQGDAEALELADESYDLIVARHLIWTLPNPAKAVQEWKRVLKPGGKIALVEGQWENKSSAADYAEIRSRLPFFGGQPSDQLAAFLTEQGLPYVQVHALMEAELWGEAPKHPRYLVVGFKR